MSHDYQYDDHEAEDQAAWNAAEAAWEERVEAKVQELEMRAMIQVLKSALDRRQAEMFVAEGRLVEAIGALTSARDDCMSLATAIEDAVRTLAVAS